MADSKIVIVFGIGCSSNGRHRLQVCASWRTINKFNSEVIYDITSYTVQHELFHMKMWLRIKERFPNDFIKIFHELSDEIHEAFVLSEFVKAKQFTKWDEADIINDLDAFNKNFKMNKTLEDFKNFDLDEYLNNL